MNILVVGANGKVGKHLVKLIQESDGHQAKAMIRDQQQASFFEELGAKTVVVDLEDDISEIAKAADGVDAIVFTAGSGGHTGADKTILIDLDGAVKTMEAAKQAGVKRFVLISSFDTRREKWIGGSFKPYVAAKYYADMWLKSTDLEYTLIHPGILTDEPGTGNVHAAAETERAEIPREDVARVILAVLEDDATIHKEFQVISGDTAVSEAVASIESMGNR
ncbi:SDR family oxidoreductase [Planococcus salinus]|uniref:SDR family oxidoreductase n=1 Tax=Planococcus salinus TaxID=1848460 RepID=A0A3M8PDV1_9BACL|nr:SDR family oxidoreductase [Planococcus salinus]RNF41291.1 SDR family oxidoreductase [Planococcus salinus]